MAGGMAIRGRSVVGIGLVAVMLCSTFGPKSAPARATSLPAQTPIMTRVAPFAQYTDSGIVHWGKQIWLATGIRSGVNGGDTPSIYHWTGSSWARQATIHSKYLGAFIGLLKRAALTHSGAPDFLLGMTGGTSGSFWFSVLSHSRGRWHAVPLGINGELGVTAWGAPRPRHGLLEDDVPVCGCAAASLVSIIWFKYSRDDFIPTTPPGSWANCTAGALDGARPFAAKSLAQFLWLGPVWQPFRVTQFTCLDGWAVARRPGGGKYTMALLEQRGHTWLRAAVASPHGLSVRGESMAATPMMRWEMAAKIGISLPRPRKKLGITFDGASSKTRTDTRAAAGSLPGPWAFGSRKKADW
jgi:hypothetical protein